MLNFVENHVWCIALIILLVSLSAFLIYMIRFDKKQMRKILAERYDFIQIAEMMSITRVLITARTKFLMNTRWVNKSYAETILNESIPRYESVVPEKLHSMCFGDAYMEDLKRLCNEMIQKEEQPEQPEEEISKEYEVGTCDWARNADVSELEAWINNEADPDNNQHIVTLGVATKRLGMSLEDMADRVLARS